MWTKSFLDFQILQLHQKRQIVKGVWKHFILHSGVKSWILEYKFSPNFPTWVIVGLEPTSTNVEVRLEDYQKVVGGRDYVWGFICPTVFPQVAVGDCRAIKQGDKVKITSLIVFQLEVQEDQSEYAGVGHMDGPRAVSIVAVLLGVAWTGDFTR